MNTPDHPVVLITGASSGIGAAVALEYARRGADLVLTARRSDRLESLAGEIQSIQEGRTHRLRRHRGTVISSGSAPRAREELGRIDVVLANAGFGVGGRMHKLELDDYRRQLETNVFGVLRTIYATQEDLIASRGCLGIVGSVNSYVALHGVSAYCMSKHAIRALACSLRHEPAPHGEPSSTSLPASWTPRSARWTTAGRTVRTPPNRYRHGWRCPRTGLHGRSCASASARVGAKP